MQPRSLPQLEARLQEISLKEKSEVYLIAVPTGKIAPKDHTDASDPEAGYYACFLRKPTRLHLDAVSADVAQGKVFEPAETIMRACWIEGDDPMLQDDEYFIPAARQISGIIQFRVAVLKKSS